MRGAGYEECGALPDEDQAALLVREHVKLNIGPAGADSTGAGKTIVADRAGLIVVRFKTSLGFPLGIETKTKNTKPGP